MFIVGTAARCCGDIEVDVRLISVPRWMGLRSKIYFTPPLHEVHDRLVAGPPPFVFLPIASNDDGHSPNPIPNLQGLSTIFFGSSLTELAAFSPKDIHELAQIHTWSQTLHFPPCRVLLTLLVPLQVQSCYLRIIFRRQRKRSISLQMASHYPLQMDSHLLPPTVSRLTLPNIRCTLCLGVKVPSPSSYRPLHQTRQ